MKLLLIMPNFFNYPQLISEELNNLGYEVDYFDDRPSTNPWVKAAIRINKNILSHYISNYFNKVMETVSSKKYDVVFLISGQSLSFSEEMIQQLKNKQSDAKFVLYQWDSQINFPYIKSVQHFFDKIYSFDRRDVEENSYIKFLPLFYSREYEKMGEKPKDSFKYDFCFVGTAHPKKYKYVTEMSSQLRKVYPKQFIYFFYPSRIVFIYRKIMNKELRKAHMKEFHYTPLKGKEMHDTYVNSRCVLDSAQAGQLGLTIRVIEALGANKKLITTNEDIINYDFYRPENIYLYNGRFDLDNVFFKSNYVSIDEKIYKKYSLRCWLQEILS